MLTAQESKCGDICRQHEQEILNTFNSLSRYHVKYQIYGRDSFQSCGNTTLNLYHIQMCFLLYSSRQWVYQNKRKLISSQRYYNSLMKMIDSILLENVPVFLNTYVVQ